MGRQGARLSLDLEFDGRRTRPRRALATPPLQISRARYDDPAEPGRLHMTLIHLGGILSGDRSELSVDLAPGAQAAVVGAAATQIYTMAQGEARQETVIRAAAGAALRWVPGPQILFAGARYAQSTRVELAPGASVLIRELLVPGRLARGECWRFDRYESLVEVVDQGGALLAVEQSAIEPARRSPAAQGVMGAFAVLGSLWLLGAGLDAERAAAAVGAGCDALSAAVLPGRCGLLVRALGPGLAATNQALQRCHDRLAAQGLVPPGPASSW